MESVYRRGRFLGWNEFQGAAVLELSGPVDYLSWLWQASRNIARFFFQITELEEPCEDLSNAFPSMCCSALWEWIMLLNTSLLHLPQARAWTEPLKHLKGKRLLNSKRNLLCPDGRSLTLSNVIWHTISSHLFLFRNTGKRRSTSITSFFLAQSIFNTGDTFSGWEIIILVIILLIHTKIYFVLRLLKRFWQYKGKILLGKSHHAWLL